MGQGRRALRSVILFTHTETVYCSCDRNRNRHRLKSKCIFLFFFCLEKKNKKNSLFQAACTYIQRDVGSYTMVRPICNVHSRFKQYKNCKSCLKLARITLKYHVFVDRSAVNRYCSMQYRLTSNWRMYRRISVCR